jgi:tetratricopeptide (TPR) repeat protein
MYKYLFILIAAICSFQSAAAQQRYFEVKDNTAPNSVYSGLDDEAGVTITCKQNRRLSFDSSMDKMVTITKIDSMEGNNIYYLVFKVGKRYRGRVLSVFCSDFQTLTIPLELQPKQLKQYLLYDPNEAMEGGCYQQHRVKGIAYFKNASYREALDEFTLSLECTDCNRQEAQSKIDLCDTILSYRKKADAAFELLKYSEAIENYRKIEALNADDKYVVNRIFECSQSQVLQSQSYYQAAEQYFKDKEYDKAKALYQRVVDLKGEDAINSALRISEIDKLSRHIKNRERIFSYEYSGKTPIGFSYGTYQQHSSGYFTLRFNKDVFDLARSEYKYDKKPEVGISFGWTINVVPKYGWIFFGPGITSMARYKINTDKYFEGNIHTDADAEKLTYDDVLKKAETNGEDVSDYLKAKYKFGFSPELGFVAKYRFIALRYTFQYRWSITKEDQNFMGRVNNEIGIGFAF